MNQPRREIIHDVAETDDLFAALIRWYLIALCAGIILGAVAVAAVSVFSPVHGSPPRAFPSAGMGNGEIGGRHLDAVSADKKGRSP